MNYVFEVNNVDYATAAEAIAVVEAKGEGSVIKFYLEPNLPNCLPKMVHRSCGLWSLRGGKWRKHSIYGGTATVIAEESPK